MHEFQSRRHVALAIFALFIIVRTVVFSSSAFAQTQARVEWKAGRLSVSAEMAPLSEIVAEVARRTGIEVQGHENLQEKASVHFSDAPLVEGLENLLSGLNYTIMNKPLCPSCPSQVRVVIFGRGASLSHDLSSPPTPRAAAARSKRTGADGTVSDINQEAAETAPPIEDIQKLRNALRDSDPNVRQDALDKLAERPGREALDTLLSAAKSDDPALRRHGLELLSQNAEADQATVLSALGEALKDKDAEVQAFAVQTLVSQGGSGSIDLLRQAFDSADPSVKALIVESVGSTPEAVPLLQEAASDSDKSIRDAASALLEAANEQEKN